jgi:hypothetical protein
MEASAPLRVTESAEISELVAALAKAKAKFKPIIKDRTANVKSDKGSYSYNYADLATVLDAVTMALSEHGIVLLQRTLWDAERTTLTLDTRLCHASGQWYGGSYPLPSSVARPQELGSALTYGKRYSATTILGIASEEDDDGNKAEGHEAEITTRGPKEKHPDCENCDVNDRVILSKFPGKKYYCLACRKNFGPDNSPATEPGAAEAAELFTDGEIKPQPATRVSRKPKPLPDADSILESA